MAVNYELGLLRHIVDSGFQTAIEAHIGLDLFKTAAGRLVFDFMYKWYHDRERFGSTPSVDELLQEFPRIPLPKPKHDLRTILDILRTGHLREQLKQLLPAMVTLAEADPFEALRRIGHFIANTAPVTSSVRAVDMAVTAYDAIQKEIELLESGRGMLGIPWPWEPLNKGTLGIKQGDFILVYATAKTGKSLFCLYLMAYLYMKYNRRIAIICGHEMSPEEVRRALSCMVAQVAMSEYLSGTLSASDKERLLEILKQLQVEAAKPDLRSRLVIYETQEKSVDVMRHVVGTYQPDAIYFDALYSLDDSMKVSAQTDLLNSTRQLANSAKIPILASWQANIRRSVDSSIDDQSDFSNTQAVQTAPTLTLKLRRKKLTSPIMEIGVTASRMLPVNAFKVRYVPGMAMDMVGADEAAAYDGKGDTGTFSEDWAGEVIS